MKMYEAVLSQEKARVFVDQIFTKFDTDNSGEIDFKVGVDLAGKMAGEYFDPRNSCSQPTCLTPHHQRRNCAGLLKCMTRTPQVRLGGRPSLDICSRHHRCGRDGGYCGELV